MENNKTNSDGKKLAVILALITVLGTIVASLIQALGPVVYKEVKESKGKVTKPTQELTQPKKPVVPPSPSPKPIAKDSKKFHTCLKGQTIFRLTQIYKVSKAEILRLNPIIRKKQKIYEGQIIRIK